MQLSFSLDSFEELEEALMSSGRLQLRHQD